MIARTVPLLRSSRPHSIRIHLLFACALPSRCGSNIADEASGGGAVMPGINLEAEKAAVLLPGGDKGRTGTGERVEHHAILWTEHVDQRRQCRNRLLRITRDGKAAWTLPIAPAAGPSIRVVVLFSLFLSGSRIGKLEAKYVFARDVEIASGGGPGSPTITLGQNAQLRGHWPT
jgi:hypothetical protein